MIALIPARAGSKRVPGKNTRVLAGQTLVEWAIESARQSGLFREIVVSTDDPFTADLAYDLGCAEHLRKPEHATDTAHDFLWVEDALRGRDADLFAILRPTSPFRTASTIRRAYAQFVASGAHSIRAVQLVTEHPGKMWRVVSGSRMEPFWRYVNGDTPFHSLPSQVLDPVYVQNASLEMAWCWVLDRTRTISGTTVCPFLTDEIEGFDINTERDWQEAERLADRYLPHA